MTVNSLRRGGGWGWEEGGGKAYRDRLSASRVITDRHVAQLCDPEFLTQLTLDASVILDVDDLGRERGWVAGTVYQGNNNPREAFRGP